MLFTAKQINISDIFKVGGAQAIGAMVFGTESVPRVKKIFGPGNQYVDAAKRMAVWKSTVAIDLPASATELVVIADESCRAKYVAADLLSQAEHGPDSQVILISPCESMIDAVLSELNAQRRTLPRAVIVDEALQHCKVVLVHDLDEAISFSNLYAPEHLILAVHEPDELARKVRSAGSVFLGNFSGECFGDYASGTNHTLPTGGAAAGYSGVSIDSFVTKTTFQEISEQGVKAIGHSVAQMANGEGLVAHANAALVRLADCR